MASLISKASLLMVPSVYEDGTLYNVLPSGNKAPDETGSHNGYDQTRADFTFSRGSNLAATRVNSDGLIEKGRENLYTYSNDFSHSNWNLKRGTFTQGEADPDGGNNAWSWVATDTDPYLYQSGKTLSGVSVASIWVKGVGSTIGKIFEFRIGTSYKSYTLTGEWQRLQHFANYTGSSASVGFEVGNPAVIGDEVHIYQAQYEAGLVATDYIETGSSTAQAGILEDMPRINYDANGENGALLLEPSRTNSILNSEYFGGYSFTNGSITTNNTTSPEGLSNGSTFVESTATGTHQMRITTGVTSGSDVTFSFYAKANGRDYVNFWEDVTTGHQAYFNLSTGVATNNGFTSVGIEDAGNGWYRCYGTKSSFGGSSFGSRIHASQGANFNSYAGDGESGYHIYGLQLEASASYASSYIPTHGAAVTRGAEGFADLTLNYGTSFTMMFDIEALGGSHANNFILRMGTTNPIYLSIRNSDNKMQWYSAIAPSGYFATKATKKIAISCNGTSWIWASDGATGTVTATGSTDLTYMRVKTDGTAGGGLPSALIESIYVSDEALNASELATLTTL